MNIWLIEKTPEKIAQSLDDETLNQQINDCAKILCNVHHYKLDISSSLPEVELLKTLLSKHAPLEEHEQENEWLQWACEAIANYDWLIDFGRICCSEYSYRFSDKKEIDHQLIYIINWCDVLKPDLPTLYKNDVKVDAEKIEITPFPCILPEELKGFNTRFDIMKNSGNPIYVYRYLYFAKLKSKLIDDFFNTPNWTRREKPEWIGLNDE